jgi:hypothetical protein
MDLSHNVRKVYTHSEGSGNRAGMWATVGVVVMVLHFQAI